MNFVVWLVMSTLVWVVGSGLERKRRGEAFGLGGMLRGMMRLALYCVLAAAVGAGFIWAVSQPMGIPVRIVAQ